MRSAEYQSNAAQAACTFELWDYSGTPAIIGTTQTGTASTSTSNVSSATFTGVTYSQLATLRVRVFGNANSGTSYVETVQSVSLVVNYTPSAQCDRHHGRAAGGHHRLATPAVNAAVVSAVTLAVTAAIAAPAVNGATALPSALAVTTSLVTPQVNPAVLIQPGIPAAGQRSRRPSRARLGPAGAASAGIKPVATATGNATVTVSGPLAVASSLAAPVVRQDAAAAPVTLAVSTSLAALAVSPGPAVLAVSTTLPAPVVRQDATTAPAALAVATALPAPAVSPGPASLAVTASVSVPALSPGPAALTISTAVPVPAVVTSGNANVIPATLAVAITAPAPVVRQDAAAAPAALAVAVSLSRPGGPAGSGHRRSPGNREHHDPGPGGPAGRDHLGAGDGHHRRAASSIGQPRPGHSRCHHH